MKNNFIQFLLKFCVGVILLILTVNIQAAGHSTIAKSDANLWPNSIKSKTDFDLASRAEILIFLSVYKDKFSGEMKAADLNIESINKTSLERWKSRFRTYWLNTFLDATKSCKNDKELGCSFQGTDFEKLLSYSTKFTTSLPAEYVAWKNRSLNFYRIYLKRQARLAALYPNPTSEILPHGDAEIIGDHFKDGEFLFSLDDGPTQNSDTAKYAELLRKNGISAFFFVVGDKLESQLNKTSTTAIKTIYYKQCLASHGYHHKSHQKWTDWKNSIEKTQTLIQKINGNNATVHFRPPYGQTQQQLINYLTSQHSLVFLWNIDTQDWVTGITPEEVSVRVKKLMLLWRKGIILFHDVHTKAFTAIPEAIQFGKNSDLHWINCSTF